MKDDLKKRTIDGIAWNGFSQVLNLFTTLTVSIVLARLLTPNDFGMVGLITVFSGFATLFIDFGFTSAIIYKKEVSEDELSTVFWFNLLIGLAMCILLIAVSGLLAKFYDKPILKPLSILISFNFIIQSISVLQGALLSKDMSFKALAVRKILAIIFAGLVAILLAYFGYGVWSIAIQQVVSPMISAILIWYLSDWRPKFVFKPILLKGFSKFSMNLVANNSLNYWTRNLDNLLIGKYIGSAALGVYTRSYALMLLPLTNVSQVIVGVLFPSLSKINTDKPRVLSIFLRVVRVITLITFPLMFGLAVVADKFVLALYGPKWSQMIPVLEVLSFTGMFQSITMLTGSLYQSQGRTDLDFRVGIFVKAFVIGAIVVGLNWGLMGVVVTYSIASMLLFLPQFYFPGKLIGLSISQLIKTILPIFLVSATMALTIYIGKWFIGKYLSYWSDLLQLVLLSAAGAFFYWILLRLFNIGAYQELQQIVRQRFGKKNKQVPVFS